MTLSFLPATASTDKPSAGASLSTENSAVLSAASQKCVGQFSREPITEAEIDAHIKSLGDLATRSYQAGDKDSARGWMTAMYAAIAGRSPAHKARLQADLDKRIDEGVCYFMAEGDKARARK